MNLEYEVQGSGPTVLMVHGLGGTSNTFEPQARALARSYRIVRPDLPGAGRSAAHRRPTLDSISKDLIRLADDFDAVHWVGHSLGTVICQIAAATAGRLVRSLALLGPIMEPNPNARVALKDRADRIRAQGMDWFVDAYIGNALSSVTLETNPAVTAFLRESLQRQSPSQYADLCIELAEYVASSLNIITAPTLLLTGDEDKVATVASVTEMATRLPRSVVQVLPKCGHWPTVEHPKAVTAALEAHLASTGPP